MQTTDAPPKKPLSWWFDEDHLFLLSPAQPCQVPVGWIGFYLTPKWGFWLVWKSICLSHFDSCYILGDLSHHRCIVNTGFLWKGYAWCIMHRHVIATCKHSVCTLFQTLCANNLLFPKRVHFWRKAWAWRGSTRHKWVAIITQGCSPLARTYFNPFLLP